MLDDIVESALYTEVKELKDGKKIVMDPETEKLYYRKTLSVFSVPVYRYIMKNDHPAIPRIKTFWQEEGNLVVIEDLIQGRTLEELLDEGEMSFEEKKRILLEICDGLIFLHEAEPPIIHRDIKASNIMVTDEGRVMIIDYDAAKQYIPGNEKDTVLIGTQGIAAPEQYGFAQSDQRTDIYAFGKLVERVLPESQQAMRIAGKATRFSPSARYKSVREMKADLTKMWDPKVSRAEHNKTIIKGVVRRKSFKLAVAAVILVILGLIGKNIYDKKIYPEYFVRRPAYEKAEKAMSEGDYEKAKEQLRKCGLDYRDSQKLYEECEEKLYEIRQQELREQYQDDYETAKKNYLEKGTSNELSILLQKAELLTDAGLQGDYFKEIEEAVLERLDEVIENEGVERARYHLNIIDGQFKGHSRITMKGRALDYAYVDLLEKHGYRREACRVLLKNGKYTDVSSRIEKMLDDEIAACEASGNMKNAVLLIDELSTSITNWDEKKVFYDDYRDPVYYRYAEQLMASENYKSAVEYYTKIYSYKDSSDRANDARYQYCLQHYDKPDSDFKSYLKLLVSNGYPGAAELQEEMESLTVKITVEYRGTYMVNIDYQVTNGYGTGASEYTAYIYFDDGTNVIDKLRGSQSRQLTSTAHAELYYHIDRIEVYDTNTGKLLTTWRR